MSEEVLMRAQPEVEPVLDDPRPGDETEVVEKGGKGGATKRTLATSDSMDPRDGEETETTERGGGSTRQVVAKGGPRDGDETTPIRESPLGPPVRV